MTLLKLLALLLIAAPLAAWPSNIVSGTVTDSLTNSLLSGVKVKSSSPPCSTTTNGSGYFTLTFPGATQAGRATAVPVAGTGTEEMCLADLRGRVLAKNRDSYTGVAVQRTLTSRGEVVRKVLRMGQPRQSGHQGMDFQGLSADDQGLAKVAASYSLSFTKSGYRETILASAAGSVLDVRLVPLGTGAPVTLVIDSIILNPYGFSPLSAIVKYTSSIQGTTAITVKGKNGASSDVAHRFDDTGLSHTVTVMGLYANYNNTVDLKFVDPVGSVRADTALNIQTGALPDSMPASIDLSVMQAGKMEPGLNLLSGNFRTLPNIPLLVDGDGEIRWLLNYSSSADLRTLVYDCGISRLKNGNFYFANVSTGTIYEVDLLGKVINTWRLTGYTFHHNVEEKPDGNFLVTVTKPGSTHSNGTATRADYIVEIDRTTGSIVKEWDLKISLDEYRRAIANTPIDWVHCNAVIYDPADTTIIVSGRVQGVFKLTYNNTVKWILGAHKGWGTDRSGQDLNKFLLAPLDANGNAITDTAVINGSQNHADFEWNWFQHSPRIMPNGDLLLFDNGATRNFVTTTPAGHYSRAVVYRINEKNMTVRQVWSYGKERGVETYSDILSSVNYYPTTNHILFCPGNHVTNTNGIGGKMVEIDYATKEVVFELSLCTTTGRAYHRAERISVYP